MFTIITPSLRGRHRTLLSHILKTREGYYSDSLTQEMSHYDTPSTIYIAYVDSDNGVFGSCRLNPLSASPASFFYRNRFQPDTLKNVREVSLITFHMEEGHPSQEREGAFDTAIQRFYRGLYEVLVSFSMAQGYAGYVTLMDEEEHPDLTFFGSWPFDETHSLTLGPSPLAIGEMAMGTYIGYHLPLSFGENAA